MVMTMADLLAKNSPKFKTYSRGDRASGKIISITNTDLIVDIGAKSEGVLSKKDFRADKSTASKVGDIIENYVASSEAEGGQIILTSYVPSAKLRGGRNAVMDKKMQRFTSAMARKSILSAQVIEVNRGGLLVEVEGVRGFLPSSHISFDAILEKGSIANLVGTTIPVAVIEIDEKNNRLIFSSRREINNEIRNKLAEIQIGQEVTGKIVDVAPFGLLVSVLGLESTVMSREISWSEEEDFISKYEVGQEIKALVTAKDENLGKISLSIRQLSKDPLGDISKDFQPDDVVSGTVSNITPDGLDVKLLSGILGFLPTAKTEGQNFQVGQKASFLVDNVDLKRRKVNLAPFLTSTKGLIYK